MELSKTKKREKIVMHYSDGSTEEYEVGIVFALEDMVNEDGKTVSKISGHHCNTRHCIKEFNYALAKIIINMLENEEDIQEFYNE